MKELNTFRKFLAEGQINENLSQNLIKVYEDEIESLIASDENDVVPAFKRGIELLQKGEDPSKVNIQTAKEAARIQGEFDWDEFARIFMDKAQGMMEEQITETHNPNDDIDIEMFVKIHDFLDKSEQDELRGDLAEWMRDNLNLDMLQSAGFTEL